MHALYFPVNKILYSLIKVKLSKKHFNYIADDTAKCYLSPLKAAN